MSIFGSIKEVLGVGGGSGKGAPPQYQSVALDDGSKRLLESQRQRANRSEDAFAQDVTANVGGAEAGLISDSQQKRQNAALGMNDSDSMRQAIQSRAKKYFDTTKSNIDVKARADAPLKKYDATQAVANDIMHEQANFNHNVMMQNQAKQRQVMARNSAIASIFQGVGSVIGASVAKAGETGSAPAGTNRGSNGTK